MLDTHKKRFYVINIMKLSLIVLVCTVFVICYIQVYQTPYYGYIYSHYTNTNTIVSKQYTYVLEKTESMYTCKALYKNICVGTLRLFPWHVACFGHSKMYIGNKLYVTPRHRNMGVANQLVSMSAHTLSSSGGFGIFSTHKTLSLKKMYTVYWKKERPSSSHVDVLHIHAQKYKF